MNLYPSAAKPQEEGVEEGDETERAEDAAVEDDDQQPTGQRLLRFPPLSDADYKNSIQQGPGHFNLSLSNFRLEFTRSPTDVLNKRALHIASQGFAAALKSGRFPKRFDNGQPVPKEFTEYKVIYALVESHFIYLSKMYKEAAHPNAAEKQEVRLKKINESTRKNTVGVSSNVRVASPMLTWILAALQGARGNLQFLRTAATSCSPHHRCRPRCYE